MSEAPASNYMSEQRILGQAVEVHITNLTAPHDEGMVRRVDYEHVKRLEKSFLENTTQIAMLAGHITKKVPMKMLAQPGKASVAVLRGNHTRLALQSLHEKELLVQPLIRMTIYEGLSDIRQLQVGVHHNEVLKQSKAMSFMEKASLMRNRQPPGFRPTNAEDVDTWKKELQTIFSCAKKKKLNDNYRQELSLSQVSEKLWRVLVEVNDKWQEKMILCQPRNKEINTTFFKKWKKIDGENEKLRCLKTMLEKGYRAFLSSVIDALKKQDAEDAIQEQAQTDIADDTANIQDKEDNEDQNKESDDHRALETDEASPEEHRLQSRCTKLEEENEKLKSENNRLRQMIKDLQSQTSSESKESKKPTQNANQKTEITKQAVQKKRKNHEAETATSQTRKRQGSIEYSTVMLITLQLSPKPGSEKKPTNERTKDRRRKKQ